jgi:hypothetical protein
MSATYDGLVIALVIWAAVIGSLSFGVGGAQHVDHGPGLAAIVVLLILVWACWGEAGRYVDYQIEELVASIAEQHKR